MIRSFVYIHKTFIYSLHIDKYNNYISILYIYILSNIHDSIYIPVMSLKRT